jgi:hypothetical protein
VYRPSASSSIPVHRIVFSFLISDRLNYLIGLVQVTRAARIALRNCPISPPPSISTSQFVGVPFFHPLLPSLPLHGPSHRSRNLIISAESNASTPFLIRYLLSAIAHGGRRKNTARIRLGNFLVRISFVNQGGMHQPG